MPETDFENALWRSSRGSRRSRRRERIAWDGLAPDLKTEEPTLRLVVGLLKARSEIVLEIDGRADPIERSAVDGLAIGRAERVRGALIALGIDGTPLKAVSCGTREPQSRPSSEGNALVSFLVRAPYEGPCKP
jgi:hypothetical protein